MEATELLGYDDIGAGPALVFVHGLTFSRRTWEPIVARLQDRFRCICVDLPGHGTSSGSAADLDVVADRLDRTLAALRVEGPVAIGHSAGAMTAVVYASRFPVAGVVNVDQPLLVAPFAAMVQQLAGQLRGPDFETAFAPFEQSIGVDRLPEPERSRVEATRRTDQGTVLDNWHGPLTTPPEALQDQVDAMLDAVDAPYLHVAGDVIPEPVRAHLETHLSAPEFVVLPGRGHLVHLADPDRFAEAVAEFVLRVSAEEPGD